eukprot:scaffold139444_cov20-Tisochrysis_lutea.AAC.4
MRTVSRMMLEPQGQHARHWSVAKIAIHPPQRVWVGTVTQLIPPNYGIVDHDAFYVEQLVVGRPPQVTSHHHGAAGGGAAATGHIPPVLSSWCVGQQLQCGCDIFMTNVEVGTILRRPALPLHKGVQ